MMGTEALKIQMSYHPLGCPVQKPSLAFLDAVKLRKMTGVNKKVGYYPMGALTCLHKNWEMQNFRMLRHRVVETMTTG